MTLNKTEVMERLLTPRYDAARQASYVALDFPSWDQARPLVRSLGDAVSGYKVGLELLHAGGPRVLDELISAGKRIFLDVKFHDIPNTVAGALRAVADSGVEMVNVHALGGRKMLEAARSAVDSSKNKPLLIAVTVLTSMGDSDLQEVGVTGSAEEAVTRMAKLAADTGMDGVVSSAWELSAIRAFAPQDFVIVVPGTRPQGADKHDQTRTLTPGAAMAQGASRLVLGRAVTKAQEPLDALLGIYEEMLLKEAFE